MADSRLSIVSGTLVQVPNWGNILLDAGEGTWGQLVRQFGDDVWKALRDLKCVFISHIHGDHHIGLAKILAMRRTVSIFNVNIALPDS
jgi:ribonuclease Z